MGRSRFDWSAAICACAFFLFGAFPLYNVDAYGHLAQGRYIAELGAVPTLDPFSFWKPTPQPWRNYEWAYDLLSWLIYDTLGPNALILIKCLMLAALGYALVILARRLAMGAELAAPIAAATLLLFAPFARIRFTVRPQIVGLVFPALLLLAIHTIYSERASARMKGVIIVALGMLQVVWVNMHGSHLLSLLITIVFLAFSFRTQAFRYMLLLLALQVVATACTPFGLGIARDALSHAFDPTYRDVVTEWSPWMPQHPLYLLVCPAVASLLVLLTMRPVTAASRYGLAYAAFCAVLSFMAFRSIRFVAHQLLFTAPFIAAGLSRFGWVRVSRRAAATLVGAALLVSVLVAPRVEPYLRYGFGELRRGQPFGVAAVINTHLREPRVMAPLRESWPLMFAVPEARLLVDGRVPFYGPAFVRQIASSFREPAALSAILEEYSVNAVVVDHTRAEQAPAVDHLWRAPDWLLSQVQDRISLFIRRGASETLTPLTVIGPGYRVGRVLEPAVDDADLDRELRWVGQHPSSAVIQGWLEGLRALRPLARDGARAGIRRFRTEEERQAAREAYRRLSEAADVYSGFAPIETYRAMAALAACDAMEAEAALEQARRGGESRATTLIAIELGLRLGDETERAEAAKRLERRLVVERSARDPWVQAIARSAGVRCP